MKESVGMKSALAAAYAKAIRKALEAAESIFRRRKGGNGMPGLTRRAPGKEFIAKPCTTRDAPAAASCNAIEAYVRHPSACRMEFRRQHRIGNTPAQVTDQIRSLCHSSTKMLRRERLIGLRS